MKLYSLIAVVLFISTNVTVQAAWWDKIFSRAVITQQIEITQDNDNIYVKIEVPQAIATGDIVIEVNGTIVHVYGKTEHKQEINQDGFYKQEMSSSNFNRSISLPCLVDEHSTTAERKGNGLIIIMPKLKAKVKAAHRIAIMNR